MPSCEMTPTHCYIDMDGVLANFVAGACRIHKKQDPYVHDAARSLGVWHFEKLFDMTLEQLFAPMDYDFWRTLPEMGDGRSFVQSVKALFPLNRIALLTSPSWNNGCMDAKRDWVKEKYPEFEKQVFMGSNKAVFAGPGRVLMDDSDANIDAWVQAGGVGLLVPRLWNRRHEVAYMGASKIVSRELNKMFMRA